jgi:hypothetical protein
MIWTIIGINSNIWPGKEKIECEVIEAPIDGDKAYKVAVKKTSNTIIAMVKGNHKEAIHFPPHGSQ